MRKPPQPPVGRTATLSTTWIRDLRRIRAASGGAVNSNACAVSSPRGWACTRKRPTGNLAGTIAMDKRLPYASANGRGLRSKWDRLPSALAEQELVRGLLAEREKLLVVVRGASFLSVTIADQGPILVVYDTKSTEPVRGNLGVKSRGGQAILERLCALAMKP